MAITAISIYQDNKIDGSNLMPIHSPLVFLADATYTDVPPELVYVDILVDGEVIDTFKAIPFSDPLGTIRRFAFIGNDILNGLMNGFDDFQQLNETIVFVEDITKEITIKFRDKDNLLVQDSTDIVLAHGASQFGDYPNLVDIYNNEDAVYYGGNGQFVYVYFYNNDVNNSITIDSPLFNEDFAQDYDDSIFQDYNDENFKILTSI